MNKEQLLKVLDLYVSDLKFVNVNPARHLDLRISDMDKSRSFMLEHAHWMCVQMKELSEDYDIHVEKIMRWFGFTQGILWTTGFYSIDKMKNDNR